MADVAVSLLKDGEESSALSTALPRRAAMDGDGISDIRRLLMGEAPPAHLCAGIGLLAALPGLLLPLPLPPPTPLAGISERRREDGLDADAERTLLLLLLLDLLAPSPPLRALATDLALTRERELPVLPTLTSSDSYPDRERMELWVGLAKVCRLLLAEEEEEDAVVLPAPVRLRVAADRGLLE
jgi:hypothetical protein